MDDTTGKHEEGHGWQESWSKHLSQIDDVLIELYKQASEKAGDLTGEAKHKIQELLDKTDMDEKARAGWVKAKAESKDIATKIESRVQHLVAEGKITWTKLTKKHEG